MISVDTIVAVQNMSVNATYLIKFRTKLSNILNNFPILFSVVLLENSISTNLFLARVQDSTEPIITPFSKGCRWNVNIPSLAKQAGLELKEGEDIQLGTIMYGVYKKSAE